MGGLGRSTGRSAYGPSGNGPTSNLRDVGPAVLGYLNRLNMSQLDAEQKSRLRRIIRYLSTQTGEDTPEHVASMLIEDPLVWLALLSRPEESTRQAAVQQLTVLLNVPIAVDPKAEPDSQAKARDELRSPDRESLQVGSTLRSNTTPALPGCPFPPHADGYTAYVLTNRRM